jgi:hypothetical protein
MFSLKRLFCVMLAIGSGSGLVLILLSDSYRPQSLEQVVGTACLSGGLLGGGISALAKTWIFYGVLLGAGIAMNVVFIWIRHWKLSTL